MTWRHDTDLQINLQALVIDFGLKSDEMELLCDNQRGLKRADYLNLYYTINYKNNKYKKSRI